MQSVTKYDVEVEIEEEGVEKNVPFTELSKSGGIVNAYNALILADKIANKKL
ncbi:hypothetical protein NBT05_06815 [Aquimarina sp. ERC-38]|uniref:hypothetical protein n=1 Tax=Aquimarina sp. ERC-38 TaxID=2949996 RepID=UPI002245295E|nr:hypothetical protein [Aquimarina sp. ERC-38]UZO82179.1 hypothetical protein NBT05_06815 [Aquimarina sp. ERC-38]